MTESNYDAIFDSFEIDYLTDLKDALQTKKKLRHWLLIDREHVVGAINVGDELRKFMTNPPEGWKSISYKTLWEANFEMQKPFPLIDKNRYKQLENMINFYDPDFFYPICSKKKMEETSVLYFDENHPITVWVEKANIAVFIAPITEGEE